MNPQQQRRLIKRMSLSDIQSILRVETGTPNRPGDRMRRYWLWRRLDRLIRKEGRTKERAAGDRATFGRPVSGTVGALRIGGRQ